jgi:hypothetical protein
MTPTLALEAQARL